MRPRAPGFGREASRVQASFDRAFWNEARRCCFDVLLPEGPDGRLRPNQLFALGLPFPLLDARRRALVLSAVEAALLTPVGLRTLARGDPGYQPAYRGGPAERDAAYHQGLVWPWLLGPYVDALFAVRGDSPATRERARAAVARPARRGWTPVAWSSSRSASSPSRPSAPSALRPRPGAWPRCCASSPASMRPRCGRRLDPGRWTEHLPESLPSMRLHPRPQLVRRTGTSWRIQLMLDRPLAPCGPQKRAVHSRWRSRLR